VNVPFTVVLTYLLFVSPEKNNQNIFFSILPEMNLAVLSFSVGQPNA
jgi:hypothetical protein